MKKLLVGIIKWVILPFVACIALFAVWLVWPYHEIYQVIISPDKNFRLVIIKNYNHMPAMPGQGGDAPGTARLYDSHGQLLHEAKLDMVQQANDITWYPKRVFIPGTFDWPLPAHQANGKK